MTACSLRILRQWVSFVNLRALCGLCLSLALCQISAAQRAASTYLGFDRNDYPGDANLQILRQTFSFTGYWLNNPPGSKTKTWTGERAKLASAGFRFLVVYNGGLDKEL